MEPEKLRQTSKEELIAIILAQAEQIAKQTVALQQLRADYEALKLKFDQQGKPPTTAKNSSQPPSQDQKANQPVKRRKRRHGPPLGHAKHERQCVANPEHIVEVIGTTCRYCQADLPWAEGILREVNQITELLPAKAQVIEVRLDAVPCPECGQVHVAEPAVGLEMHRTFGARLEATVVY